MTTLEQKLEHLTNILTTDIPNLQDSQKYLDGEFRKADPCGSHQSARSNRQGEPSDRQQVRHRTEAEIDVVARWLTGLQSKFPKGEDE